MVALGFMAVSGIIYQMVIKGVYGDAVNGLFGQAFAYYVAAAQLAVCGIHFSVLKYASEFHDDQEKLPKILGEFTCCNGNCRYSCGRDFVSCAFCGIQINRRQPDIIPLLYGAGAFFLFDK